jgi:aldehyde dehydrogenase
VNGRYFSNITPITGEPLCEIPRSDAEDINLALDAAHAAAPAWGRTPAAERSRILNRIADRMEENLELLTTVETLDHGKPIRETMAADLPLAGRSLPLLRGLPPRPGRHALGVG